MNRWLEEATVLALVLAGGIALLMAIRVMGGFVGLLPTSRVGEARMRTWLPIVGVAIMVVYVGVALRWLVGQRASWLVPVALLVVVVGVSWKALRDVADGLVLRSSGAYRRGDKLTLDTMDGRIAELGWRFITVETTEGTVATIPWSTLAGAIVQRAPRIEHAHFHAFRLALPDAVSIPEVRERVSRALLLSPWCLYERDPEVRAISGGEELEVVVGLVDRDHEAEVEALARQALAELARRTLQS